MQNEEMSGTSTATIATEDEVSLVEILTVIGQSKYFIAKVVFATSVLTMGITLLMPNKYTAQTLLMPPQSSQSGASAALAALSGLTGGAGPSTKSVEQMYAEMLKSETVENAVIQKFKLKDRWEKKFNVDARVALESVTQVSVDKKSGLIRLQYTDEDPELTAKIANSFHEELQTLLTNIGVSEAQQRKKYFEIQLGKTKADLSKAEISLREQQAASGLASIDAQTQAALTGVATLRAQIFAMEVELQSKLASVTQEHPDIKRLQADIAIRKSQLAKYELGNANGKSSDVKLSANNLAAVRAYRELKFHETLYGALVQQYHVASADAAKEAPLIQQIDPALTPERKSSPRRAVITIVMFLLSGLLSTAYVVAKSLYQRTTLDPKALDRFTELRNAWKIRRKARAVQSS